MYLNLHNAIFKDIEMIIPEFRVSFKRKICYKVKILLDYPVTKYIILPIFFIIPISFFLVILGNSNYLNQIKGIIGENNAIFLKEWSLWLFALLYFARELGLILKKIVIHYSKPDIELDRNDLLAILGNIEPVILRNMNRLLVNTKKALDQKWEVAQIFEMITNPDEQIGLLVCTIHGLFEHLTGKQVELRVGLMSIKDGKPCGWYTFAPLEIPPHTGPEILSAPTSTIMRSISAGKMVVVEDIQKELKKNKKEDRSFVNGSTNTHSEGSIFAYPISCPNTRKTIYVLSIHSNKSHCILKSHIGWYTWIIERFVPLILLEHHLNLLKEKTICPQ